MLIVSQDKDVIINFDNVEAIGIGKNNQDKWNIFVRLNSNYIYKIAEYDTEEKAKSALEDLANYIALAEYLKCVPETGKFEILETVLKGKKVNICKIEVQ